MALFEFKEEDALGAVASVDTAMVTVRVGDIARLRRMQVNRLVALESSKPGEHLIGVIQRITRSAGDPAVKDEVETDGLVAEENLVRVVLIGTHIDKKGKLTNVFRRTLETVPEIDANCFAIEGKALTDFMGVIAAVAADGQRLTLGTYTLDENAAAYLNGNKLFQRHAIIVGSTGAGKSWTTASILEQVAQLANANAIVFDIHGEYTPLKGDEVRHFKICGPGDLDKANGIAEGILHVPFWLLGYEAMISMFVDRSDQNAPNQAMLMSRTVVDAKRGFLEAGGHKEVLDNFTIDSPIPFDLKAVLAELENLNKQMVPGAKTDKQGPYFDKLSRLIARLENKMSDRRLGFLFRGGPETQKFEWLETLCSALIGGRQDQADKKGGVKVIDFSEVPSDILPLIVSLLASVAFSMQQWTLPDKRHPIALFCDEAHLYIPERFKSESPDEVSVGIFERIAKEGRKYGVGLVVISQRPSEVNRTVLSQCNNLISMRLTNAEDQNVVRRLLPDSLGGFSDLLPILDTGEALVVGDASLLPSRIRVTEPNSKPNSGTVEFWDKWADAKASGSIPQAVEGWRRQNQQSA